MQPISSTHRDVTYNGEVYRTLTREFSDGQIHVEIDRARDHEIMGTVWAARGGEEGRAFMWKVRCEPAAGLEDRQDVYTLLEDIYRELVEQTATT